MRYQFELYILQDKISKAQWQKLYEAIMLLNRLGSFELLFTSKDNVIRFFISCDKDLSNLSNAIDGLLLRPVDKLDLELPQSAVKNRFFRYVTGGNILDIKEKLATQKSVQLEYAVFTVKPINKTKAVVKNRLYMRNATKQWLYSNKLLTFFPTHLFAIDFSQNTHYLEKTVPTYLNIEKSLHMLTSENQNALFEVDTLPYFTHNYYLNLPNYEFDKHSFIIGATGSGKSKLISLYVDRLYQTAMKMNYRVIIIDPHASLAEDFNYLIEKRIVNFNREGTELFADSNTDISAATELTVTLMQSLIGEQYNPRLDRLLRFSLFVLFTSQNMSLDMLKRFLTDLELRNQVIDHVREYVPTNLVTFFGADFNELKTSHYNETIMPIISLVDEMQMQPSLVKGGDMSLANMVQENFLTVFSLNKVSMGEKTVKTIAGLLIQQIFLLAQSRAFGQKVILIIDEVSVVQNPALASILAEARKFNLTVILTQQYFGQIDKGLQDAIFANAYNYYVFKVSEEDARALEGNLNIEIPQEVFDTASAKGLSEPDIRVKILTELHPRECLIRLAANGQINPCLKARTVEAPKADPTQAALPAELDDYDQAQQLPTKFVEKAATQPSVLGSASANAKPAAIASPPAESSDDYRGFSLSELLAQHSSSRKKVSKKKD